MKDNKLSQLIPDNVKNPFVFLGVVVLPQLFLFLFLFNAWSLLKGELTDDGISSYMWVLVFQGILILGAVGLTMFLRIKKIFFNWICGLSFFVFQAAITYGVFYQTAGLAPSGVPTWMFNVGAVVFMMALAMVPGLFYSLLNVAAIRIPIKKMQDYLFSFVGLVIFPVVFYLMVILLGHISWKWYDGLEQVFMIIFILGTAATFVLFFRCMLHLYHQFGNKFFVRILACLVFPIAGLCLNILIPFPANLQDWTVYALTVLNAIVVFIPAKKEASLANTLIFCARSIMFTFTLYFFLLFLPFLPLSLPAMISFGAGFLILAPTFLFFIHSRLLIDEGRTLANRFGFAQILILFVCMLMVLPALYTGRALYHKQTLMSAVDAVYAPDYSVAQPKINSYVVKKTLKRLQAMSAGIYVPILSDYYNKIVFNGMVLPPDKIKTISEDLLGEEISLNSNSEMQVFDLFSSSSRSRSRGFRMVRPPRDVNLLSVDANVETVGAFSSADVTLNMNNPTSQLSEFECCFDLPSGVFVSKYWLDIEGKKVDGMLFDRKAAEWVYKMIRDTTPRDPGLVVYKNIDTIQLNVYPFNGSQTRKCGFSFIYPSAMQLDFNVHSNSLQIVDVTELGKELIIPVGNTSVLFINNEESLPTITRKPIYHIMIDASVKGLAKKSLNDVKLLFQKIGDSDVRVTMVNYGSYDLNDGEMMSTDEALVLIDKYFESNKNFKGGFNLGRALKRAILEYKDSNVYDSVPLYIVVGNVDDAIIIGSLDEYQMLKPDTPIYVEASEFKNQQPVPVYLFKTGNQYKVSNAGEDVFLTMNYSDISYYDSKQDNWIEFKSLGFVDGEIADTYIAGVKLWDDYISSCFVNDSDNRKSLLALARECGVLYPQAAYIVLENSAQWEFLKNAEGQSLESNEALEFDAPAPGLLMLLIPFLLWQMAGKYLSKHFNYLF
jgi:hypothetical protein